MFTHLNMYNNGTPVGPLPVDEVFAYNIRYQILCQTEEEHDYLSALQLMYGREVQIDTWDGWNQKRRARYHEAAHFPGRPKLRLLPIVFTTFDIGNALRGL